MPGAVTTRNRSSWQRRFRRLLLFVGTATSFYLIGSYFLDRLREARARAIKEKKEKDLMRNHFTSLQSTINYTLYALLPTLQPQVTEAYPVEATSSALQSKSTGNLETSDTSTNPSFGPTPDGSLVLDRPQGHEQASTAATGVETPRSPDSSHGMLQSASSIGGGESSVHAHARAQTGTGTGTGESWASEFHRQEGTSVDGEGVNLQEPSVDGSGIIPPMSGDERVEQASSTMSQSFSLPPTDISSASASPPSDLSPRVPSVHLHSPSQGSEKRSKLTDKTKKELWKDLKLQTLTRSITTAYLVTLIHLLTSSQLATLARLRYLEDIKRALPDPLDDATPSSTLTQSRSRTLHDDREGPVTESGSSGLLGHFSIRSMGLSEFVDGNTPSIIQNPRSYLPSVVDRWIPTLPSLPFVPFVGRTTSTNDTAARNNAQNLETPKEMAEAQAAEDEKAFLAYSWWILHEGWRDVARRVEAAVEEVFGRMALKKDLTTEQWAQLIREVRARIETTSEHGAQSLYSFTSSLLPDPNYDLPSLASPEPCPLLTSVPPNRTHLLYLLSQTRAHLFSPDGAYLIERGVTTLVQNLIQTLDEELYPSNLHLDPSATVEQGQGPDRERATRRLVDCLPVIDRWGKGVWEGVPDNGVEALLALPEFEGFMALIFGDWAPTA